MRILECCQVVVVVCSWMRKCCSSRLSTAGKFVAETCKLFRTGYPPPPLPPPFPPNRHQQDTVPRTPFSCLADKHLSRWGWCPSSDNGRSGGVGQWPCPGRRPLSSTLIFNSNLCCHPSSNVSDIIVVIIVIIITQNKQPMLPPFFKHHLHRRHHCHNHYIQNCLNQNKRNICHPSSNVIVMRKNILEFGQIYFYFFLYLWFFIFIRLYRSMMRKRRPRANVIMLRKYILELG